MKRIIFAVSLALNFLFPDTTARSQVIQNADPSALVPASCQEYIPALCGGAAAGTAQRACLLQNVSKLSGPCVNALTPPKGRVQRISAQRTGLPAQGAPPAQAPRSEPAESTVNPEVGPPKRSASDYDRVVVISDLHVPENVPPAESAVINDISSWKDVSLVAVTGDVCEKYGSPAELARAKKFLARLKKPYFAVTGNHDYIYEDKPDKDGNKVRGSAKERAAKLNAFTGALQPGLTHYTRQLGRYLLVFLSVDDLDSKYLTEMSGTELNWFTNTLGRNKSMPTIVFFHSPLKGTLGDSGKNANTASFVAQPVNRIRDILAANRQVVLWVSGHTHTSAGSPDFNSAVNRYSGTSVTDIHNSDVGGGHNWTNSLYLYGDRIEVRTYDHKTGSWLKGPRVIKAP